MRRLALTRVLRTMSNDRVSVAYNDELKPLEAVLAGVKRAGDFVTHGRHELPMPKVEVEGVGVLSFPVPELQLAGLISQGVRAPYGRGEETILDLSVRKVWQVSADKIRISGKSWAANFDAIMARIATGLGCELADVSVELYKLLIYDEGGFFSPHRDTEKAVGMFGTLVLVLPSDHRGGELLVRHAGREVAIDLSGAEVSEVAFAAFYADCEHEVRPIAAGHRVCLIYNLIQVRGCRAGAAALTAPDYTPQIVQAAGLLDRALGCAGTTTKVAWLLEHHYSPAALAFSALKSTDAAKAKVLADSAARAGCAVHLAIVHIEESGPAEPVYSRYENRYEEYDEDEDDFEKDGDDGEDDDFEVVEVTDSRHYLDGWTDPGDQPVPFGKLPLDEGELLPEGALDDEKPDQQRLTEATGNEGASFERSYHRAAVVIWHRDRHADVLLQAGVGAVLPWFRERIAGSSGEATSPATRRETAALARRIMRRWRGPPGVGSYMDDDAGRPANRAEMIELLGRLGDAALLEEFVGTIVTLEYDGGENAALAAHLPLLAPAKLGRVVSELIRQNMPRHPTQCIELLQGLLTGPSGADGARRTEALHAAGEAAVAALDVIEPPAPPPPHENWESARFSAMSEKVDESEDEGAPDERKPLVDPALVENVLTVLGQLDPAEAPALRDAAARKMAARPAVFDPVTVMVPALGRLRSRKRGSSDSSVEHLWTQSAEFLLRRSEFPPESPKDWRQEATLLCRCPDCRELLAFARDPMERAHRFRVRKDRRQHLHRAIEEHGLEMTHVTERKGSPQTLVCTKDRRGYRQRCRQYNNDIAALATLADLTERKSDRVGRAVVLGRIDAARRRHASWSPL